MLHDLVVRAAEADPRRLAVHGPDTSLTYGELDSLGESVARELTALGVTTGDRVATWDGKSAAIVGAMQGALRCGAAYVPIDPTSPIARVEHILRDCGCRAIATTPERHAELRARGLELPLVSLEPAAVAARVHQGLRGRPVADAEPHRLAYILYTSGSTGTPKGVCISHENALSFVRWAQTTLSLEADDRLSNHAAFHFDLSVLDLYGAFAARASVYIVNETAAYAPAQLVEFLVEHQISVWYSVPSALMLMVDQGGLLEAPTALRSVIFAGEVYPARPLQQLQRGLSGVRLHNFYGPTETNVCTAHEVQPMTEEPPRPIPIGQAASGDSLEVLDHEGRTVPDGTPGQLWVTGPTVMLGYWGKPAHEGAYPTGDIVVRDPEGCLTYVGRIDHQVKIRGHRIELLEIEAVLAADPRLKELCVVVEGTGMHAKLTAFAVAVDKPPSLIALKRLCAEHLPKYMIVDAVHYLPALPRTGNGKVDRAALAPAQRLEERAS